MSKAVPFLNYIRQIFRSTPLLLLLLVFAFDPLLHGQDIGSQTADRQLMATGRLVKPVGSVLENRGRPVDVALSHDGKFLFAKANKELWIVGTSDFELVQSLPIQGGASLYGLETSPSGNVYLTNSKKHLAVYSPNEKGVFEPNRRIELPQDCFPCGLAISNDEKTAYVCLSKRNSVAIVDLENDAVTQEIKVGVAPFDVSIVANNQIAVSNIGGRLATDEDTTATSAGTKTVVDSRGIANNGTVNLISLDDFSVVHEFEVGLHPSVVGIHDNTLLVCNTNSDSISLVNLNSKQVKSVDVKPDDALPFGSMPSAVCVSNDGNLMFVALAGNNSVAVFDIKDQPKQIGLIPTGWYPASLACDSTNLHVGNIKGVGARQQRRDKEEGWNSHDHQGNLQQIPLSDIENSEQLKTWTQQARANSRVPQILRTIANETAHPNIAPVPVPEKRGEPSLFKHVIYVVKENRTFDQVFGDVKEARSDPNLCVFPENVTPNHHALAKRFGLLDNYYCNGVLSADGHSWATEGNVTPYLERAFGGFARSYTFGDDPITYSSSGFLWDRFLDAGLSFRNYGELNYSKPPKGMKYVDIYKAFKNGEDLKFEHNIGIERLKKYSNPTYPGWNMQIPDVLRMDRFLKEFKEFESNDGLPNLSIIYLPQDHLGGGVLSRSHMADNDLALGQLVEAVSNSKFWKDTVIFVNEDDPQNGYDHVDGHRSLCLVISAYSKPGIQTSFFNQTSVLRTILHLFGLSPLNQQDASMPLMTACFQPNANLTPYKALPANFPLDELPAPKEKQSSLEIKWRTILATVPIERTGMKTESDEDNLNRFVWHDIKGWNTPYPTQWSGAHGRGLKELRLKIVPSEDE